MRKLKFWSRSETPSPPPTTDEEIVRWLAQGMIPGGRFRLDQCLIALARELSHRDFQTYT